MHAIHRGVLKISDAISWIAVRICAVFLSAVVVITLLAIFYRYILQTGLSWPEELSRCLNIWIIFLGASAGFKYSELVGVEFFIDLFPKKFYLPFRFLLRIGMFCILTVIAYYCFLYTASTRSTTPAMMLHYAYVNVALFTGFAFMLVHLLEFLLRDFCAFYDYVSGFDSSTGGSA
ncbi:MAG: TRAP transporter small permease [Planctomycetes bacterium]|nr:TRAP transporter small permease [Planctomycetota bacterium]